MMSVAENGLQVVVVGPIDAGLSSIRCVDGENRGDDRDSTSDHNRGEDPMLTLHPRSVARTADTHTNPKRGTTMTEAVDNITAHNNHGAQETLIKVIAASNIPSEDGSIIIKLVDLADLYRYYPDAVLVISADSHGMPRPTIYFTPPQQ